MKGISEKVFNNRKKSWKRNRRKKFIQLSTEISENVENERVQKWLLLFKANKWVYRLVYFHKVDARHEYKQVVKKYSLGQSHKNKGKLYISPISMRLIFNDFETKYIHFKRIESIRSQQAMQLIGYCNKFDGVM